MKRFLIFIFMFSILLSSTPLYAVKVVIEGQHPKDFLETPFLQRSILPSLISSKKPLLSDTKEAGDGKHSLKNGCLCLGCCSGKCSIKRDYRHIVNPDDNDYSTTVFVTTFFPSIGWRRATGIIIGNHSIALAAHSVRHEGQNATEVIVLFGMREVRKCGCFCISRNIMDRAKARATTPLISIHQDYLENPDSDHDIAVITFNKPPLHALSRAGIDISSFSSSYDTYEGVQVVTPSGHFKYGETIDFTLADKFGSAKIAMYEDGELRGAQFHMIGYPVYVGNSCRASFNMHATEGIINDVQQSLILYKASTSHGQSGAGIRCGDTNVGLHIGEHDAHFNKAVRFDQSVVNFLTQSVQLLESSE